MLQLRRDNPDLGPNHFRTRETMRFLAAYYLQTETPAEAESIAREWIQTANTVSDVRDLANAESYLAIALLDQGQFEDARQAAESALKFFNSSEPSSFDCLCARLSLALAQLRQQRMDVAEPSLRNAYEQVQSRVGLLSRDAYDRLMAIIGRVVDSDSLREDEEASRKWQTLLKRLEANPPGISGGPAQADEASLHRSAMAKTASQIASVSATAVEWPGSVLTAVQNCCVPLLRERIIGADRAATHAGAG
jgi:tetratricopeptide (TPR) repeat protein